jgi:signal transduction histidine kinase
MSRFLSPLVHRRPYLETFDLLLDLVVGVVWFTVFTTLITTGASLLITLIGLPILTATFYLARAAAHVERIRARALLDTDIRSPLRKPAKGDGVWHKLVAPFADRTTWKELFYLWLVQPVQSIVNFTVAVVAWSVPLWAITLPIYAVTWKRAAPELWSGEKLDTWGEVIPVAIAGLIVLPLAPWIIRAFARADAAVARWGLSESRTRALEERVAELRETQARSVDIAMADRRQIERDLHDGAQQRLLSLGMDLGMALEKFESDPDGARALVGDAHAELQRAIAELRNLARGIHPAVLTDRGLDAALSALAARSPIPVTLDVQLQGRPAASVEATAYFIVAEALANAAKHAHASAITIRVRQDDHRVHVEVADNGIGGATQQPDGGLAGLADRASSVEGSLRISSPEGGPTIVAAELPCAS